MKKILILLIVLVLCLFAATGCNKPCDPEKECCDGKGVNCPCEGYDCPCEGYDCPCEDYDCPCEGDDCIQPDCDPEVECCDGEGKCDCDKNSVICKIQTGLIAEGTEVMTECVVTGIYYDHDDNFNPIAIKGIYVSDIISEAKPYTGIYVFIKETAGRDDYVIGDKLEVSGKYREYYESSQIEMTEIKKLGTAELPEPAKIEDPSTISTTFEENVASSEDCKWGPNTTTHGVDTKKYEAVLVKVEDVTVTNANICHGAFEVTGHLAIDKTLHFYKGNRSEGTKYDSVRGILIHSYDAYRLAPTKAEDIVECEDCDVVTDDEDVMPDEDVDVEPSPATIKEIQSGTKEKKDLVRIENVTVISPVLSKNFDDSTTGYTFYVSDGNKGDYSGLYIYQVTAIEAPAKGDKVTIEGQVDFYGNQWEIKNAKNTGSITKTGTGTVPAALEKAHTALSDKDKGSLIEITDELTVKSVEKPEGKNYTKITFEEKVGDKELIAENFGNVTFQNFQEGDKLHVKGIYDVIFGSNGFYIIDANDIEKRIY